MRALLGVALASLTIGCGTSRSEVVAARVAAPPLAAARAPTRRAAPRIANAKCGSFDEWTPRLGDVARSILAHGDRDAIAKMTIRMIALARWIDSDAWKDAHLDELIAANTYSGLYPDDEQLADQLGQYQEEMLAKVVPAVGVVGGDDAKRFLLGLAGRARAGRDLRAAALDALDDLATPIDANELGRMIELRGVVGTSAPKPSPAHDEQARVMDVITGLRPALHACYARERKQDQETSAELRLEVRLDDNGLVTAATASGEGSAALHHCAEAVLLSARFDRPPTDDHTIVIPFSFRPR